MPSFFRSSFPARPSLICSALFFGVCTLFGPGSTKAAAVEADRECLVRASFAHPADLAYAQRLAIEVLDESPVLEPTLHLNCRNLDEVKAFARTFEVIEEDMQAAFARERARIDSFMATRNVVTSAEFRYKEYLNLDQMNAVVEDWAKEFPKYVDIEEIGRSVKDRPIRVVNISRFKGKKAPKHRVVILNGHHAREWLASASTLCFSERLLRGIDNDPEVKKLMSYMTFSLIVMGNPDGYVMTHNGRRMQRKNAREVDLNRNWDIAWGTVSSSKVGAEDYHGSGPFSEPETKAYSDFIAKHGEEMVGFVDIHAFLSAIMAPYGYIRKAHPREKEFAALMNKMTGAMTGKGMIKYKSGPIHSTVYQSSGCSEDWVDDKFPQTWSLAIEVRGKRFDEPPSQIEPTCNEIEAALMVYLNEIVPMDGPLPDEDDDDSEDKGSSEEEDSGNDSSDSSSTSDENSSDPDDEDGKDEDEEDDDSDDNDDSEDAQDSDSSSKAEGSDSDEDGGQGDMSAQDNSGKKSGCRMQSSPTKTSYLAYFALFALFLRRRHDGRGAAPRRS